MKTTARSKETQTKLNMYDIDKWPERKAMRFKEFDYSTQGAYFLTVVTNGRRCLFGHVVDGEMILNDAGRMVGEQFMDIERKHDDVGCMAHVVMPNHFHGVIYLDNGCTTNVPGLMRDFKSHTSREYGKGVRQHGWPPFNQHLWQRNYWDDIIWNQRQYEFIIQYIATNPQRWEHDNINDNHVAETDHILKRMKELRYI